MDKNKISENAAKLVAKGAWDKAIKEYELLLKMDPRDVRVLQKLGELHQKKGDNAAAATWFVKVAENFSGDGFFLKAVAQYKQALKLNPAQVELNLKLAELHQRLQLVGEAMAYLQVLANHYNQVGDVERLFETLTKMVDLEPENPGSRVKLAELFAAQGKVDRALLEYRRAADQYRRSNRMDDLVRSGERILALDANDGALGKELARLYVQRGEHTRALGRLQPLYKADPTDVEMLELLGQAFEGLGQQAKAAGTWKLLARTFQQKGNADEAERAWGQVERLAPGDTELQGFRAAALQAAVVPEPVPPPAPAPAEAPAAPVAVAPPPRAAAAVPPKPAVAVAPAPPRPPSRDQMLGDAAVQLSAGDLQGAMERLQAVLAQDPEDLDAHELAYNVYAAAAAAGAPGMVEAQVEQLLNVLRLCKAKTEIARAQPFLDVLLGFNPGHPEVPEFIAVLRPALARPVQVAKPQAPAAPAPTPPAPAPVGLGDEPPAPSLVIDVSATGFHQAVAAAAAPVPASPAAAAMPLGDDALPTLPFHAAAPAGSQPATEPEPLQPRAAPAASAPAPAARAQQSPAPAAAEPVRVAPPPPPGPEALAVKCDQARVLLGEGKYAAGRALVREVLAVEGAHPWALSLLQWADQVAPEPPAAPVVDTAPQSALDLGAQISSELGDAVGELPAAAPEERQVSVEEVFTEFKKGLARVVKPEDVDTHYDLGIAYKEMGLLEDALSEFNVARQGCVGKRKEVDCLAMVALLQAAAGQHEAAVKTYAQALASPHAGGEVQKAILYDLAATREQMGAAGRALTHYLKVLALDAGYRDVGRVVARLRAQVQPEADPIPGAAP